MKKSFLLLLLVSAFVCLPWIYRADANDYLVRVDSSAHQKFGLYYPATYKFRIPEGSNGLTAQYRYSDASSWSTLGEKSSADLFNGIDAVRFDYAAGIAYVSIRFSRASDAIYIRITDALGQPVEITFDSIPKYYDGRKAAVSVTLDDWAPYCDADFTAAAGYLAQYGLAFTVMVITDNAPWPSIQSAIDKYGDLMEIGSHSAHHSCDGTAYSTYGYGPEIVGARDAIRSNLTSNALPYVPLYGEPCGYSDASLVSYVTSGDYLVTKYSNNYFPIASKFVDWDAAMGRYGRAGITFSDSASQDNAQLLSEANAAFDRALSVDGIYHLADHPWQDFWHDDSYLLQHLNYIKGRSNIWYVPFGQMYLYHYLQEMRGNLTVQQATAQPTASFTAAPLSGAAPLTVSFSDASTGAVIGWLWEFGDGSTATEQNPTHVYAAAGSYTVKLTVSGPGGSNSVSKANSILVNPATPPMADFSATQLSGLQPLSVNFTDRSTGAITGWMWDFGDGSKSSEQNPTHVYDDVRTNTVKLTVTGPLGSSTAKKDRYIVVKSAKPVASFTATPRSGLQPLSVQFSDTSTGTITGWLWDFGDHTTSTEQNPQHSFVGGTYNIKLTVTGPYGNHTVQKKGYIKVSKN